MSADFEAKLSAHLTPGPEQYLSGAVVAYTNRSGSKSYLKALGYTTPDASTPLREDAVFWSASCTKLLTTIACLKSVELGLFSLDASTDVARLLPELVDPDLLSGFTDDSPAATPIITKAKTPITLRHLLSHSSGLSYSMMHPLLIRLNAYRGSPPPEPMSKPIPEMWAPSVVPLVFEPGTGWAYGPGLDWAGLMLERASPTPLRLGAFMQQHIFAPLGMASTSFDPSPDVLARVPPVTAYAPDGTLVTQPLSEFWPAAPADHCGGVGIYTSVPDYLKVLASLLRNDGLLLRPESVDSLFEAQVSDRAPLQETLQSQLGLTHMVPMMPPDMQYTHSFAGIVSLAPVEGRLGKGTLMWSGLPNLSWYIDRETGYCGFFGTEYVSLAEPGPSRCSALKVMFQKFAYAECSKE